MLSRIALIALGGLVLTLTGCARSSIAEVVTSGEQAVAFQGKADGADGFVFPADKAGKAVSQLLQPTAKLEPVSDVPPGPRPLPPPPGVGQPGVPLSPTLASPPSPPSPRPGVLRPRMLPENAPLADYRGSPTVPALRELETGSRIAP